MYRLTVTAINDLETCTFIPSPGDVWWAASDIGWTVGHGYICYSPLLNCNTTVMYEGKPVGTPDAGQFFRSGNLYSAVNNLLGHPNERKIYRLTHQVGENLPLTLI